MKKIEHNYQSIEGWFNMEEQYLELLKHCPDGGIFVELGCYKGKSTSFIVTEIINQNRDVLVFAIDSFEGATESNDLKEVEAYKGIDNIQESFNKNLTPIMKYLSTNHLPYSRLMVNKNYSDIAAENFKDNSVDVIFIDAGHSYESVKKDIEAWLPKMKKGGIMAGHDYWAWEGVRKAVNEEFRQVDRVENDCWFKTIK
jgi:predicted O-methyltransferase YrrM